MIDTEIILKIDYLWLEAINVQSVDSAWCAEKGIENFYSNESEWFNLSVLLRCLIIILLVANLDSKRLKLSCFTMLGILYASIRDFFFNTNFLVMLFLYFWSHLALVLNNKWIDVESKPLTKVCSFSLPNCCNISYHFRKYCPRYFYESTYDTDGAHTKQLAQSYCFQEECWRGQPPTLLGEVSWFFFLMLGIIIK